MTQTDLAFIAAISIVIYATGQIVMWVIRAAARRRLGTTRRPLTTMCAGLPSGSLPASITPGPGRPSRKTGSQIRMPRDWRYGPERGNLRS